MPSAPRLLSLPSTPAFVEPAALIMLPFLEVDHLPSSSSFYSAIIQPLGLRYLTTEDGHFPSITYGHPSSAAPVFQIRQVASSRDRPLRISRLVLSAPSAAAVDHAYEFALRANPDPDRDPWDTRPRRLAQNAPSGVSARRATTSSGGTRVLITDFVGNMTEIVYQLPPEYPPWYNGSTTRITKSTTDQATRILDWNFDVADSSPLSKSGSSSGSGAPARKGSRRSYAQDPEADDQPRPGLRRSVTAGSSVYEPATSARENSNGLSAGAVVGTLLGVAAGAALGGAVAYNMGRGNKYRPARHDDDMPSLTRRSTEPDQYDTYPESGYFESKPRYIKRTVEKVQYSADTPPASDYRRPSPEFITRYSEVDPPRSRDVDDGYSEPRGRHLSSRTRTSSAQPRSESASHREAYDDGEREYRSYTTTSKSSRHPPIVQRSYAFDPPNRVSSVSTRSRRSNSTVRAPAPELYSEPTHTSSHSRSHSRSSSRVTTTTYRLHDTSRNYSGEGSYFSAQHVPLPPSRSQSFVSACDIPLPESRAPTHVSSRRSHEASLSGMMAHMRISAPLPASKPGTYVSAYNVPLPDSRAGSRYDYDDGDDDADSVAPSDSISCVGSRRSGRSRR